MLWRAKLTISEERGKHRGIYKVDIAQNRAKKRKSKSRKTWKLVNDKLQHFVIRKLKDGWFTEIISSVWNSMGNELKKFLQCTGHWYKKRYSVTRTLISDRVGIEERPKIINARR